MKITKCDCCKKEIDGDIYDLEMRKITRTLSLTFDYVSFDICKDCYMNLCKKLRNTEENEDGNTES